MNQNPSVAAFQRTLSGRYSAFRVALRLTVDSFAEFGHDQHTSERIKKLGDHTRSLINHLHEQDRPPWLAEFQSLLNKYSNNGSDTPAAKKLLSDILLLHPRITDITVDDESNSAIDFDQIYEQYRLAGELPQLFDELIRIIQEMINSGEIETITALAALNEILALLRCNRDGSFVATKYSVSAARFLMNLVDESIKNIPVLRELRAAYTRTVEQAEQEVDKLERDIRAVAIKSIAERLPKLENVPHYHEHSSVFLLTHVETKSDETGGGR